MRLRILMLIIFLASLLDGFAQSNSIKIGGSIGRYIYPSISLSYERLLIPNLSIQPEIGFWKRTRKLSALKYQMVVSVQLRYYCILNDRKSLEGIYAFIQPGTFFEFAELMKDLRPKPELGLGFGGQVHILKRLMVNPEVHFPGFQIVNANYPAGTKQVKINFRFFIRLGFSF